MFESFVFRVPNFESQKKDSEAHDRSQSSIGLSSKVLILSMIMHAVQVHFTCLQSKATNSMEIEGKDKIGKRESGSEQ